MSVGGLLWGLILFLVLDPTRFHWAWFTYGFFPVASAAAIGILVMCNHWIIRARFRNVQEVDAKEHLEPTKNFNGAGFINGVVERIVFTTLAWMLVSTNDGPLHVGDSVGVLASIAGGWVLLKSLAGWRSLKSRTPIITALSMTSITASLTSVFVGVLGGVLTLHLFDL